MHTEDLLKILQILWVTQVQESYVRRHSAIQRSPLKTKVTTARCRLRLQQVLLLGRSSIKRRSPITNRNIRIKEAKNLPVLLTKAFFKFSWDNLMTQPVTDFW